MMKAIKLDQQEKEVLNAYERGELKRVKNFSREAKLVRRAAARTLRKDCRVNIRIAGRDLENIRARAAEEGIPYQTLISSILHKFVSGRLLLR
jgi:predicted DNA binding CopG/RHH family protein